MLYHDIRFFGFWYLHIEMFQMSNKGKQNSSNKHIVKRESQINKENHIKCK